MNEKKTQSMAEASIASPGAPAAERVLKALTKLVSGRKIYASNNPRLVQFREELATTLREFFALEDELVLTIEQFTMSWNEAAVYENTKRDESLAFMLYKDGIGELTIMPAAIGEETDKLVKILADELHHVTTDEDVVTRFWNADFQHITYRVLDDYLDREKDRRESGEAPGLEETADHDELLPSLTDKGRKIVQHSAALVSIDTLLRDVSRRHYPGVDANEEELAYQRLLRAMFSVPVDEIELYRQEVRSEQEEDGIASFFEAIYVFALMSDNPAGVRDISSVLERLSDYAVTERQPQTLLRLVRFIQEFNAQPDLSDGIRKLGEKMLARVCSSELVASLLEGLAESEADADAVISYATSVGEAAVAPLVRSLHRGGPAALHRRICDALIAINPRTAAAIIDRLDVDQPEVAVDAVYLAKSLKLESLSPRLRELVFYPDARVKLEMLGWIATQDDPDTTNLLLASLGDLDRRIRLRVLDALSDRSESRVRERLTEMAFAKDLGERAPDEQDAIFRALGSVGDAGTVVQLRTLVEKRRLLSLGKGAELKLLAIRALERIHDAGALDLLAKLGEDPAEAVRLRASRAHQTLSNAMAGGSTNDAAASPVTQ